MYKESTYHDPDYIHKLYESLKEKYEKLKVDRGNSSSLYIALEIQKGKNEHLQKMYVEKSRSVKSLVDKNDRLKKDIEKLKERIKEVEDKIDSGDIDGVVVLPKSSATQQYVTLRKYNKQKNLVSEYAGRYCDSQREVNRLREEIKQLKETENGTTNNDSETSTGTGI